MGELVKLDAGAILQKEWINERDEMLKELAEIEYVESESELTAAGRLQTKASKHLKVLDKHRTAVKKPITDWIKENIDDAAKEMGCELAAQVERVKRLNGDYATKLAKEAEAERQRIAEEEARKVQEQETQPLTFGGLVLDSAPENAEPAASLPTGKVSTGANNMVTVWEYEILNGHDVPREFLSVDQNKIRNYMIYKTKMGETPSVPGIRFTSRVDVRSR